MRPEDAVAVFAKRGLLRPSFRWQDIWQEEHMHGFAVAGVMRLDVLGLIRTQVATAVEEGTRFADFRNTLREQLQAKGWWGNLEITDPTTGELRKTRFDDKRLQLIYDVNLRQSHAAGRWTRGMRGRMPLIWYRTMGDERVRQSHRPWDDLVLPRDHPFWDAHLPPNGWRCRCTFSFTDEVGVERLIRQGVKVKREAPEVKWVEFLNRATGQTERVPRGVDPGFAYNPGKVGVERSVERLERGLARIGPTAPGAGDALDTTRAVVQRMRHDDGFKTFLQEPPPRDVGMPVAAVPAVDQQPSIASVSAKALRAQAKAAANASNAVAPAVQQLLPTQPMQWALAQLIIDNGQRLELANGAVLWWRVQGMGAGQRVQLLELERAPLVWWTRALITLTRDEALAAYPALAKLI